LNGHRPFLYRINERHINPLKHGIIIWQSLLIPNP